MTDYRVLDRLQLPYKPVGVKFSMTRPEGLPRLDKKLAMCEMLREAQLSGGFYAARENHACAVGPHILGQSGDDPAMLSGMIGPKLSVYQDTRANRSVYVSMKTLDKGTGPYTLFAPLDRMSFAPDLLILVADTEQAEIVLRAHGYRTGRGWHAKGTTVAGCACLYTGPFLTGQLNLMVTGLHHGMKARGIYPPGLLMLSIPYQLIPEVLDSLEEMEWDLPQYRWGKDVHVEKMREIGQMIAKEVEE